MTSDATPVIRALLDHPVQPDGLVLAAHCLAERPKGVEASVQHEVISELKVQFLSAEEDQIDEFAKALGAIRGSNITAFMRSQIGGESLEKQIAAIRTLGHTREDDPEIEQVRDDLIRVLEANSEFEKMVAARESLAQVGDPRFLGPEPIMVQIPRHSLGEITSLNALRELIVPPEWRKADSLEQRLALVPRIIDFSLYVLWHVIRRRETEVYLDAFEISKYPITNVQYSRFVEARGHSIPKNWIEGTFAAEEATHPVAYVYQSHAANFCEWLSDQTGKRYRLPTEWEWEVAARGIEARQYPWGNEFDEDKCNTLESQILGTTPVGIYRANESPYGVCDMSGNVWEITRGFTLFGFLNLMLIFFAWAGWQAWRNPSFGPVSVRALTIIGAASWVIIWILSTLMGMNRTVSRGGAWYVPASQATCYHRQGYYSPTGLVRGFRFRGFRCVREL